MENRNIEEVIKSKKKLENDILSLICKFEIETRLTVSDISNATTIIGDKGRAVTHSVFIEVKL